MQTLAKIQVTARYAEKLFLQIYRDLDGDTMLVPIQIGTILRWAVLMMSKYDTLQGWKLFKQFTTFQLKFWFSEETVLKTLIFFWKFHHRKMTS